MEIFPSQQLQSSVLAGPKIRAGGRSPTEKCTLESVLNCQFSDTLGASHAGRVSCAHLYYRKASAAELCAIQVKEIFGVFRKTQRILKKIKVCYGAAGAANGSSDAEEEASSAFGTLLRA